jgi:hypothetical protein
MQVSKAKCILHLSDHHGDGTPGSAVRIETTDVEGMNRALLAKNYRYARPGVESTPWGTREMTIADPFGNRLIFFQNRRLPMPKGVAALDAYVPSPGFGVLCNRCATEVGKAATSLPDRRR